MRLANSVAETSSPSFVDERMSANITPMSTSMPPLGRWSKQYWHRFGFFRDGRRLELLRHDPEGSLLADVAQLAALPDQCQAVGESAVGQADGVVHSVDDDRHADSERDGARRRDLHALVVCRGIDDLDVML